MPRTQHSHVCLRKNGKVNFDNRLHIWDDSENCINNHHGALMSACRYGSWMRAEVRGKLSGLVLSITQVLRITIRSTSSVAGAYAWWAISLDPQSNPVHFTGQPWKQWPSHSLLYFSSHFSDACINFNYPIQLILGIIWLTLLLFTFKCLSCVFLSFVLLKCESPFSFLYLIVIMCFIYCEHSRFSNSTF